MSCPFCQSSNNKVVDKRAVLGSGEVRRRRECLKCRHRFTTYERISAPELIVIKKDGRRQPFDKLKIAEGIAKSLEKRPSFDLVDEITAKIESKLRSGIEKEIPSKLIGKLVLTELKKVDKVAYLRFASVYRQFENPADFAKELSSLGG